MFKRLAMVGVAAIVAASFGTLAASAQEEVGPGSFTLTVDKTAHTNQFKTAITLTGTYNCAPNAGFDPVPDFTGIGANVSQIQGKGVIVTGGNYYGPLVCDGITHDWAITDIGAYFGSGMDGIPATWKGGRATANVNGGASSGDCQFSECVGIGASVDTVIRIH